MISNAINHFWIYNDRVEDQKIRDEFAYLLSAEKDWIPALLIKGNATKPKCDCQSILINFLVKAMAYFVQNLESTANNPFGFSSKE